MSEDVRSKSIEDLELSVRSYELLQGLGVSTVGDLLDLPTIVVPGDWPAKIARLVGAEIGEVLGQFGYAGEIVVPPPVSAKLTATGDVGARWRTIAAWLEADHPNALAHWNPPASVSAIIEAEGKLGQALPDDYKQFLALHDGQQEFAPFVGLGWLLSIADVIDAKRNIPGEATPVDEDGVGEGVRAVDYCEGWIPITRSGRGRDYLCIDLDPAPGGMRGQIVEYVVDDDARPLVAKCFADLLSLYFEQAQTGALDLDEELP